MPIVGAWIADEFLGRLKTIYISIAFAMTGHIILIVSALPPVVKHSDSSLGCFCVGLVIYGMGVGGFKYVATPLSTTQLTV
jgi:POT family proton-dependent oligopeptide transporter